MQKLFYIALVRVNFRQIRTVNFRSTACSNFERAVLPSLFITQQAGKIGQCKANMNAFDLI